MAKKKAKNDTEPIVAVGVDDHGSCADCGNTVDVVVDPYQLTGNNAFVCVPCRCERIRVKAVEDKAKVDDKAEAAITALYAKATSARHGSEQSPLEFPKE